MITNYRTEFGAASKMLESKRQNLQIVRTYQFRERCFEKN